MSTIFLLVAPLVCICLSLLNIVASLLWKTLAKAGHNNNRETVAASLSIKVIKFNIAALMLFVAILTPTLVLPDFIKFQILVLCAGALSCCVIINTVNVTSDHVIFLGFSVLTFLTLITSSDVIIVFFSLELLNMLVIYSFFLNAVSSKQLSHNSALKISTSCVYQFILNFFSSIILYTALNGYVSVTGGSSIAALSLLSSDSYVTAYTSLFLSAFLLKFGSGPWIFFKINIYRNLSFVAVFMYTVIYMLCIFTFFLNLSFVYGFQLLYIAKQALIALAAIGSVIFSGVAFQSPNFFVFVSFSSLINITMFLIMALCV